MYTYIYLSICNYVYIDMFEYMCIYKYTHVYIYIYVYIYIHINVYTHIHICIYIFMFIYIFVYIHIYTHTYTHVCICIHMLLVEDLEQTSFPEGSALLLNRSMCPRNIQALLTKKGFKLPLQSDVSAIYTKLRGCLYFLSPVLPPRPPPPSIPHLTHIHTHTGCFACITDFFYRKVLHVPEMYGSFGEKSSNCHGGGC